MLSILRNTLCYDTAPYRTYSAPNGALLVTAIVSIGSSLGRVPHMVHSVAPNGAPCFDIGWNHAKGNSVNSDANSLFMLVYRK